MLQWLRERPTVRTILILACLVAPGYVRQEFIIHDAQDAATEANTATEALERALIAIETQTDVARKIACDQQNVTYDKINDSLRRSVLPPGSPVPTPEEQAVIDAFLGPYLIELRDCTPQGIADYYSTQVVPEDGRVMEPNVPTATTVPTTTTQPRRRARPQSAAPTPIPTPTTTGTTQPRRQPDPPPAPSLICALLPPLNLPQGGIPCLAAFTE